MKNENHDFWKLGGLNPLKCFQSDVGNVWVQKELILAWLVHSQVWWIWLDFVTWWCVGWKTKIMIFENWVESILSTTSKVMWKNFGIIRNWSWYGWCIAKFSDSGLILWLGGVWGDKRKSWFWKSGWTQTSQRPPKWCGKGLGVRGIDLGMVGTKPSLVIWLDFLTWWCVRWKTKIIIFENWVDSIRSKVPKVMWNIFLS